MTSSKVPSANMVAQVHDDGPVDHVAHHGQVVLDQEDRHAPLALEGAEHVGHLGRLVHVEAGGGLVGQEDLGSAARARASSTRRQ